MTAPLVPSEWFSDTPTLTDILVGSSSAILPKDRPCLTVLTGIDAGRLICIDGAEFTMGRDADAGSEPIDPSLSRRHARFFRADHEVYVQDLGSTNGTFVQGRRVIKPVRLQDGDRIQLGPYKVVRFGLQDTLEVEAAVLLHETRVRDATSGAFNRAHLEQRLPVELAFATRSAKPMALLLLDIDEFKRLNDTHGHVFGDGVLRVFAASVQRLLRAEDVLVRYGGDEFVVLCRDTTLRNGLILAERIRATIERLRLWITGNEVHFTVSIGVATSTSAHGRSSTLLLEAADAAMYQAKRLGGNGIAEASGPAG